MKRRNRDIFWALIIIAMAIGILAIAFGFIQTPTTRLVWSAIIGIVALSSLVKLNWFGFFILSAIIIHIYATELGLTTIWPVYLAAVLLAIGVQMITSRFTKKGPRITINSDMKNKHFSYDSKNKGQTLLGEEVYIENSFSEASKYIQSSNLRFASIENNFGHLRVYFDQAHFSESGTTINVENNFGKTTLYLPRTVRIDNQLKAAFGGIDDTGDFESNHSLPIVKLVGEAVFGAIEVIVV